VVKAVELFLVREVRCGWQLVAIGGVITGLRVIPGGGLSTVAGPGHQSRPVSGRSVR
jgi:hypothetical protein